MRHSEFAAHRYPQRADEISAALESEGFWFRSTLGNLGSEAIFGDTIVTEARLRAELPGPLDYLGTVPNQMQHLYAWRVPG